MSESVPDKKVELRRSFREKLKLMSAEERTGASAQICQRLLEQAMWQTARSVLCYVPTAGEPGIWPLVIEALGQGKQIAILRYVAAGDEYVPCLIREADRDLEPGRFGILEPSMSCPKFDLKQLDLALIPGIGFSLNGGRLGRGKGYYDRLLAAFSGFKCGVAFDCQLADDFPLEPHDVRLNCILTPTRCHSVSGQRPVLK